ncbi:MAG: hypothetical protein KBS81_02465 [Spirochaetales bacterium]|nr:hypothetical protein [Candidatus Physcosoma equi]
MIQEYKCPCCGGAIAFDSTLQKMKCPYCDTEFEMETLKEYDETLKEDAEKEDAVEWETKSETWEDDGLKHYVCQSCGGEVITDETLAATSCPYCGNPIVLMHQFQGLLKPQLVVPFTLDKKTAVEKFKEHLKGKFLLPSVFSTEAHLEEVKGVYVPVWLFDADAVGNGSYDARRIRHWSDSRYRYTETSHYLVKRSGSMSFVQIPVDGSEKMPDELMESIQPYDMSKAVDFQTAYLAGFLADRYDVDAETSSHRAIEKAKATMDQKLRSTVHGYTGVTTRNVNIRVEHGKECYALLPVWLLHTKWKNGDYYFAMNGQTGKFVGNLPCDKKKKNLLFWGITLGVTVLTCLVGLFIG